MKIDLAAAFPTLDTLLAFKDDFALIHELPLELPSDHRKAREEALHVLHLALEIEAKRVVESYAKMANTLRAARARKCTCGARVPLRFDPSRCCVCGGIVPTLAGGFRDA